MLNRSSMLVIFSGSWFRSYPKYSKISALPDTPLLERFPCFATIPPEAATTKAAVVDTLNVCVLSPPVPHTSMIVPLFLGVILMENSCISSNIPSNSSSVSPLSARFERKSAFCVSVVLPLRMSDITFDISL